MKFSLIALFRTLTLGIRSGQHCARTRNYHCISAAQKYRNACPPLSVSGIQQFEDHSSIKLSYDGLSGGTLLARSGPAAVSETGSLSSFTLDTSTEEETVLR
jgi:hypothetical protein